MRPFMPRSRGIYLGLVAAMIFLGLASRRFRSELPWFVAEYAGDTLWAAMVYFIAATIWRNAGAGRLAVGAFCFSLTIELSQLYHAPWIDTVRATRLGGLVLGYEFLWSDLVCYAAGVGLAAGVDSLARRKARGRSLLTPANAC
jgi:hypothetical protein